MSRAATETRRGTIHANPTLLTVHCGADGGEDFGFGRVDRTGEADAGRGAVAAAAKLFRDRADVDERPAPEADFGLQWREFDKENRHFDAGNREQPVDDVLGVGLLGASFFEIDERYGARE